MAETQKRKDSPSGLSQQRENYEEKWRGPTLGERNSVCLGLQDYFRDISDHLVRLNQSIDSLRDMVTTAISVSLSLITLQENEVTKRLAAYGALIAVPTLIAGIYGMNFQYMPEIQWVHGYPVALLLMAFIDLYMFFRFRKARWL